MWVNVKFYLHLSLNRFLSPILSLESPLAPVGKQEKYFHVIKKTFKYGSKNKKS